LALGTQRVTFTTMVLAYHLILSAYGFWLPNDPRGSWSDHVRRYELLAFGPATKVTTRRSVAHIEHDRAARETAKKALRFPPVVFTGIQAKLIGDGFAFRARASGLRVWACAVLPDHAHLVVGRHSRYDAETMMNQLKGAATYQLVHAELHPFATMRDVKGKLPSVWASSGWKVYLNDERHIRAAVRYVEMNPVRAGLRRQRWRCVTARGG